METPAFQPPHGYLPQGEHQVTWRQARAMLTWNAHRTALVDDLEAVLLEALAAGAMWAWVNGSLATAKERPSDFDVLIDIQGVRAADLTPRLRSCDSALLGGDVRFVDTDSTGGRIMIDRTFGTDANGVPKGVLRVDLRTMLGGNR